MNQTALHKMFIGCAGFLLGSLIVALAWYSTNVLLTNARANTPSIQDVSNEYDGKAVITLSKATIPDTHGPTDVLNVMDAATNSILYAARSNNNGGFTISVGKGDDSGILGIRDVDAAGDAATSTQVIFVDGIENIRSSFSTHASQLAIVTGAKETYTVTPRYASDICSEGAWPPSPTPSKTTQLLGITVTNDDTSKDFYLSKPTTVTCDYDPNIGQMNPGFEDVSISKDSSYFFLADGTRVWIAFDPTTPEFKVELYPLNHKPDVTGVPAFISG